MSYPRTIRWASLLFAVSAIAAGGAVDTDPLLAAHARIIVENAKTGHSYALRRTEAVPTREIAVALSVAVWTPIFGAADIAKEAPFQALRVDDCWFVTGSLSKGSIGGAAIAVINASDGRFLMIAHEQ